MMGRLVGLAIIAMVRLYQRTISRIMPPTCRFAPSCSTYMIQAGERHGACRGMLLGLWRILRCNPFCRGGFDPVPVVWGRGEKRAGPARHDDARRHDGAPDTTGEQNKI